MVNISDKQPTYRTAIAQGQISMTPETLARIRQDQVNKGDVLQVARIAAIMAGKKTSELIPLCHTIQVTSLEVNFTVNETLPGLVVEAEASSVGKTGAEMEALTAVSIALLTIYDMAKSLDRAMVMSQVKLLSKEGGKSGQWSAE
ncbi:MAG: cyclic pyranopterin monophosphate synthase MoaC [Gemmatimonadetes bacterium]|jgi:cyclic pyranopterin phosphate synthase|nr:cyclic pyranopterin monophosphate synthase MoaC [Gemmatimonadota bacterium]MCH2452781.1 cyclic pyranopterin monophosphate synthase MoaC [Gemmatimonadota bacterium]|tara:strand:+ start:309 stop:743 length:435 start_codon:yes stop_codon:yes gene_type:complete